jgi:putative acetyltransferase
LTFRPVEDRDAQDLYGLLTLCFAQYPGCYIDPHDDMPDMITPTLWSRQRNGAFWVMEDETGRVCACAAVDMPDAATGELHRIYVRPDRQGKGLGKKLITMAEQWAIHRGATRLMAWSDTRFATAHAVYTARGYVKQPETRDLGDVSNSTEFLFLRILGPADVQ